MLIHIKQFPFATPGYTRSQVYYIRENIIDSPCDSENITLFWKV